LGSHRAGQAGRGFLLAPLAWLLDLQISYAMVKWACATNQHTMLLLMPLGSLSLIGLATGARGRAGPRLGDKATSEVGACRIAAIFSRSQASR
jgi:hypothetical protein